MANPSTPPGGIPHDPATAVMFEAQEHWAQHVTTMMGMVEQTRRAGFTRAQSRALVASALVHQVATSAFVRDGKDGGQ